MKTTIYFYETNAHNGLLYVQGDKALNIALDGSYFNDVPHHRVDLEPMCDDGENATELVVQQLKSAYGSVSDQHIMYDMDDMIQDYGDSGVFAWNPELFERVVPIATIDGSCGTIEILEESVQEHSDSLEASLAVDEAITSQLQPGMEL